MGAEWIEHKGKKIIFISYVGLKNEEITDLVHKAAQMIVDSGKNDVLSLSDVTGCFFNNELMDVLKEQSKISMPLTKKAAVVGITGIKKILLNAVNAVNANARKPFDTVEAAKDWLVE